MHRLVALVVLSLTCFTGSIPAARAEETVSRADYERVLRIADDLRRVNLACARFKEVVRVWDSYWRKTTDRQFQTLNEMRKPLVEMQAAVADAEAILAQCDPGSLAIMNTNRKIQDFKTNVAEYNQNYERLQQDFLMRTARVAYP